MVAMEQVKQAQLKGIIRHCHRIGCENSGQTGIRDTHGTVLVFCFSCYINLVNSRILDLTLER